MSALSKAPGRRQIPMDQIAMQDHQQVMNNTRKIAQLERDLVSMQEALAELKARRGPGRPRKVE